MAKCWNTVWMIPAGVAVGLILGIILRPHDPDLMFITLPGDLLCRLLQMVTVSLCVIRVMLGVSSVRDGTGIAVALFIMVLDEIIGLTLVLIVQPGVWETDDTGKTEDDDISFAIVFVDLIKNLVPRNIIMAIFEQFKTYEVGTTDLQLVSKYTSKQNVVGQVVVAFVCGLALRKLRENGSLMLDAVTSMNRATTVVVQKIESLMPLIVIFMMTGHIIDIREDWETVIKVGKFLVVVLVGLLVHGLVVLPLSFFMSQRRCQNKEKRGEDEVSTAIHSTDGTVLYITAAVAFITQLNNIRVNLHQLFTVIVIVTAINMTDAKIPATGSVTVVFALTAVGIPVREIFIVVAVDWLLLDCWGTIVNNLGDYISKLIAQCLVKVKPVEMDAR